MLIYLHSSGSSIHIMEEISCNLFDRLLASRVQMLVELLFPRIGIFGDLTFCVQIKAAALIVECGIVVQMLYV